jgi:hypothetical protein
MSTVTATPAAPAPVTTVTSIVARDFPGWLPPMLVKELRQGLRTRGFVGTLVGFQIVMLILTLIALSTQNAGTQSARMAGAALTGIFWVVMAVQLIFVTPSRALGGLQLEVDARTLDLLMLTRLTAWRVVLGKWISLLAQATLLLVAMLPYLVVRYFTDNADLMDDLGRCLAMLGVSAVLTAAGLWGSGVAKLVRVLMGIVGGVVMLNVIGMMGPLLMGRMGPARPPFSNLFEMPFDLLNGIFITAFFLVSAVRNIAPPAENHSLFARVLPLLVLLPSPFAEAIGAHALAVRQLYIAAAFLGFVVLFELGADRNPMPTHWRDWHGRGGLSRAVGRLAMPGWASAWLMGVAVTVLWAMCALVVLSGASPGSREHAQHVAWLALLALGGLTFPAVMRSFAERLPVPRALFYFFGLALPALLAGVALGLAESRWKFTGLKAVMEAMPFSSFLFALNKTDPTPITFAAQGMVAVIVLALAAWQSRGYWQQLQTFEARDRAAANAAAEVR